MYQGVLRDDERRVEKMRQRQAEFEESKRKRALYESVQRVDKTPTSWGRWLFLFCVGLFSLLLLLGQWYLILPSSTKTDTVVQQGCTISRLVLKLNRIRSPRFSKMSRTALSTACTGSWHVSIHSRESYVSNGQTTDGCQYNFCHAPVAYNAWMH